jgi:hypothetical protein
MRRNCAIAIIGSGFRNPGFAMSLNAVEALSRKDAGHPVSLESLGDRFLPFPNGQVKSIRNPLNAELLTWGMSGVLNFGLHSGH